MDSSLLEPPDLNFSCNPRRSVDLEEDEQEDSEKESRIAARRKRIQLKIEADRREALGEKPAEVRCPKSCIEWNALIYFCWSAIQLKLTALFCLHGHTQYPPPNQTLYSGNVDTFGTSTMS